MSLPGASHVKIISAARQVLKWQPHRVFMNFEANDMKVLGAIVGGGKTFKDIRITTRLDKDDQEKILEFLVKSTEKWLAIAALPPLPKIITFLLFFFVNSRYTRLL